MSLPQLIVLLVAAQRLLELVHAKRNSRRLLARGGEELGARHYPLFVLLHGGWLVTLLIGVPPDAATNWWLIGLFVALQAGRLWVIRSLGGLWTTRIISLAGEPLVRRGPYRWVRHPNYLIVAAEIAVLPLAFGAWEIALAFSLLNLPLLWWRIRVENSALAGRQAEPVKTGIRGDGAAERT